MKLFAVAGLFLALLCFAQQTTPPAEPAPLAGPAAPENQTLTIPAGTRITLALTNPIRTKFARPGDTVRVTTAFPVVVGSQLALPAGTYMEGLLDKVIKRGPNGHPGLQMHFTRIIFSNGYTVPLDGATAEANSASPRGPLPQSSPSSFSSSSSLSSSPSALTSESLPTCAFVAHQPPLGDAFPAPTAQNVGGKTLAAQQPPPTLPPTPQVGPGKGVFIGLAAAGAAASIVGAVLLGRHRLNSDYEFEAGWQFDLVLGNPVSLDSARVAAAISATQ